MNDNVPETVKRLAVLHIHTGFGKAGFGEPIYVGPEKDGYETAKKWYGQEVSAMRSTLMSPVGGGVWAINGFRNSGKSCARRDLSATAMPQALLGDVAQS